MSKYSKKYQKHVTASAEEAYKRLQIKETDIDKIFESLDIDKSGTLDINEARAFFIGKYNLHESNFALVFKKYDFNRNGYLDREEFRILCIQINCSVDRFSHNEMTYMAEYLNYTMPYTTFACCCCICTLCTSWSCANYCIKTRSEEVLAHAESTERRLNECILMDLQKGINMDDGNDYTRTTELVKLKD